MTSVVTVAAGRMSGTESVILAAEPRALTEAPPGPYFHLISAVHALYRACQRRPPVVLVARSGDDFVRMLALLAFRPRVIFPRLPCALAYPGLMLVMVGLAWTKKNPSQLAEAGWGLVSHIYIGASVLVISALASRVPSRMSFGSNLYLTLLGYTTGAACGGTIGWLLGKNEFYLLFGVVAGTAGAVLLHYVGIMLWAIWSRWRLGHRERARVPLSGDHVVHNVFGPRLRSAAEDVIRTYSLGPDREGRRLRQETPPLTASMQAEAARRNDSFWRENGPLLGPVARDYRVERLVCGYALERVATVDQLPAVLRAAVEIDTLVDAATFMAATALLLPPDSPLSTTQPSPAVAWSRRRSCRSLYRQVLAACNAGYLRRLAIDLAPSDKLADRLLAKSIVRLQDSFRRQTAIHAMGEARLIAAAGIRPMQSDKFGDLYLIGPEQNPLALVKVWDASPTAEGVHHEHWLSVPPHMATAREAVAWTFGMSESAYAPAAES